MKEKVQFKKYAMISERSMLDVRKPNKMLTIPEGSQYLIVIVQNR